MLIFLRLVNSPIMGGPLNHLFLNKGLFGIEARIIQPTSAVAGFLFFCFSSLSLLLRCSSMRQILMDASSHSLMYSKYSMLLYNGEKELTNDISMNHSSHPSLSSTSLQISKKVHFIIPYLTKLLQPM